MSVTARDEALRLGERLGWVCLPCYRDPADQRWHPRTKYAHLREAQFDIALWERLWEGHDDALGLGAIWPSDVVEVEADSDEGADWIRKRRPPRTPTFSSRRGPHYLFRGEGLGVARRPAPGVEVLSSDGKALLILPPTPPKAWFPSLSPTDVALVPLPPAFALRVPSNGHRNQVRVRRASEIPPGEAHDRMVSMLGKLGRVLSREELEIVAARLNEGRLPDEELAGIVAHVLEKEGDAGRYFNRDGFIPAMLAGEISEAYGIRIGAGRRLFWYRDGVYQDSGREQAENATRRVLGDRFKARHAEEVIRWLRADHETIPEAPNQDLLNVRNGMLDWRTGELRPHSAEHLSIVQLPVDWNPDAVCPRVDEFLGQVLPDDAQALGREILGYLALASARLRRAFMLLGSGSNGKSTFLALARALLGTRNVCAVPLQQLGENRFAAADLYGKLANVCGDLDARALRHSDLFKTLTGGADAVRGERKYEGAFSFVPFAAMLFSANEAPASSDQSDAYFDRWIVLPFEQRFEEDGSADPFLVDKLTTREELEGLLVQAVSGLMDLMERGHFRLPPSVRAANEEYRSKVDTVRTFLDEACELRSDYSVQRARLFEAYREWCGRNGRIPINQQTFAPRVRHHLRAEIGAGLVEESPSASAGRPWKGLGVRA